MKQNDVDFTPEQQKVIDLRGKNILVSAAAGSGKTAVLVERIIQLITDRDAPVDIDTLLVVTFTRAAAAQMKDKINEALFKYLEKDPENGLLQRQAALIHNAHIMTIDAFCQYVLNNSVTEAGADPGLRIADDGENKLIESDVMDRLIEELYSEGDEEFLYLADHMVAGADDKVIAEAIAELYKRASSGPWPKDWLKKHASDYDCPDDRLPAPVENWFSGKIKELITRAYEAYEKANVLAEEGCLHEKNIAIIKYEFNITSEIIRIANAGESLDHAKLSSYARGMNFDRFSASKGENEDPEIRAAAKALRDEGKACMVSLTDNYLGADYESYVGHVKNTARLMRALASMTIRYIEELEQAKRDRKIMSFADCEQMALDILVSKDNDGNISFTESARSFRDYFSYVFIDEYQDSNLVQELILSAVSGEANGIYNRFMVGDIKQSIYRFRQADPGIFIDKYAEYGYEDEHKVKIDLNKNFRSRMNVLDASNELFRRVMTPECGGSIYDDSVSLKYGADYPEPDDPSFVTELIFADSMSEEEDAVTDDGGDSDADEEALDYVTEDLGRDRIEGHIIADRINELMGSGFKVTDHGVMRPVRYSDIVILYRSGLAYAQVYKEVLESCGIPAHLSGSKGYFSTFEISTLMNLLRVIANPLQDIYFYGTMEGTFGGFAPEEIARISLAYRNSVPEEQVPKEGYLYPACCYILSSGEDLSEFIDPELKEKLTIFLRMIRRYRELSGFLPVEELLETILSDTGYMTSVGAMYGGDRREANVRMLVVKAVEFAKTSYFGLYNFIRYIDNLGKSEAMDAEADIVDEKADVVRIMTTHKSKGLEFPVCFITRMGNRFNLTDANGNCISDYEAGVGLRDVDADRRVIFDTLYRRYVADTIKSKSISEEMRILYVAMTRAKEKLILVCAGAGKADEENGTYLIKRPGGNIKYIDWYLHCICDELGADSFELDGNTLSLPGLCINIEYRNATQKTAEEESKAGSLSCSLKIAHLEDLAKHLSDDNEYLSYLRKLISYEYPHTSLKGLYSKTSVSDLKKASMDEDDSAFEMYEKPVAVPAFISGNYDRSGATLRGSAFHRIMELMDFEGLHNTTIDESTINEFLDERLARHSITGYERDIFKVKAEMGRILKFLENETATRMMKAALDNKLYREAPFIMGISASKLDEAFPDTETVLIQGIIDAYWIEDGQAVILDYKTDRTDSADRLVKLYKKQLDLYGEALVQMGIPVKEKLIYSFELGVTIPI